MLDVSKRIVELQTVPAPWLRPNAIDDATLPLVKEAEQLLEELTIVESQLFANFDEAIMQDVDREMLLRFRLDYGGFLKRILSGAYKRDVRLVRSHQRDPGKLDHAAVSNAVELAIRCSQLRDEWSALEPQLSDLLGSRFRQRATDWEAVKQDAERLSVLLLEVDVDSPARIVFLDSVALSSLDAQHRELTDALKELEMLERQIISSAGGREFPGLRDSLPMIEALAPSLDRLTSILSGITRDLRQPPADWLAIKSALDAGERVVDADATMLNEQAKLTQEFGQRFRAWDSDWADILSALDWTARLVSLGLDLSSGTIQRHATEPNAPSEYAERRLALEGLLDKLRAGFTSVDEGFDVSLLPWASWDEASLDDLRAWALSLHPEAESANDWLAYRSLVIELDSATGPGTGDSVRKATSVAGDVPAVLQRRLMEAWLDALSADVTVLGSFSRVDHEAVRERFEALDRALPAAASREIRKRVLANYPARVAITNAGEMAVLRDQLSRRRRQMPVRRLLARIPTLAKRLKPCFMMSPLAVSQYLPRSLDDDFFDVVIFDEASQVFPEDAVPAISRAAQAIVVGDAKQLPPTSFFRRLGDDGTDSVEEEDEEEEADALEDGTAS